MPFQGHPHAAWNRGGGRGVQRGVDGIERDALRAEGLDPDDPAVVAALDMVRWELELLTRPE